jgi:CO/xanthine dehydrogenase FAD-binding subunit
MSPRIRVANRDVNPADYRRGFGVVGLWIQILFFVFVRVYATLERALLKVIATDENMKLDELIQELSATRGTRPVQVFRRASASTPIAGAPAEPTASRAERYKEAKAGQPVSDLRNSPDFMKTLAGAGLTRDSRYVSGRRTRVYEADEGDEEK